MMPRAMGSSVDRTERMFSCISPPSRREGSAACKRVSRCSSTWSRAPKAGKQKMSNLYKENPVKDEGGLGRPLLYSGRGGGKFMAGKAKDQDRGLTFRTHVAALVVLVLFHCPLTLPVADIIMEALVFRSGFGQRRR